MSAPAVARQTYVERLMSRISDARARCEEVFAIVRPAALYDRPIAERHRIVFYMGHLEAFDWNLLRGPLGLESFHPTFDRLFAFGIDPVNGNLPDDQPKDWPSVKEIHHYNLGLRKAIDKELSRFLAHDADLACLEHGRLLEVAIEHRLMHAETLSYMLHQLPLERKFPQSSPEDSPAPARFPHTVKIPAGVATLGMSSRTQAFGWDNEFEEHRVKVPAFTIDAQKVTNLEYLRFVIEGGYRERTLWTESGWQWITSKEHEHPAFWVRQGKKWAYRTMFKEIPLPLDWPVYVSHDEATAYARWVGKELPSEAEWHRAAYGTRKGFERAFPWGDEEPDAEHGSLYGNFDLARWDPVPVGSFPEGASAFGVSDMLGNGWEWTRTPFAPFHGFEPFPFYPGYSADFFDRKHFVMKGGSSRTAACMLRRSFRNWFQPHYPYVYAGFRCIERGRSK
jgi:gamma-glutamyl hercynylcysteine S-oxide synthase